MDRSEGVAEKTPRDTAEAEAYEESGVRGKVRRRPLGSFEYRKERKRGGNVLWRLELFLLEVKKQAKRWPERHERRTRWFKLKDAARLCSEPGLARLVRKFGRDMKRG